ncbi:sensor histidine kinase [Microbacterium sp. P01]|uniref:sensor histidine kinase n=1 Tax=unclassified Microbacterium TaxID=2609290 RepID=UPI00366F8998
MPVSSRTRSIWLTQLLLGASILILAVLVFAISPQLLATWHFTVGSLVIVVITLASLAVPWAKLPRGAVLVLPFLDALAIGVLAGTTELRFGFLWVFPVVWVAIHFDVIATSAMLGLITMMMVVDLASAPTSANALRTIIVTLSFSFVAISVHQAMSQIRAYRRLQRRQARRLKATAIRQAELERQANELLNSVDMGVARLSLAGRILAVNDTYSRLYGLDALDLNQPGKSVEYATQRGMPVPIPDRPFARAARGETFEDARVWLFTPDGEWRALSISARRLGGADEEQSSTLLLVHDVTAITHAQRERERLVAIASHELRNPLTIIISTAELALEDDTLAPRMRARLEAMLNAGDRMLEMTTTMLSSSRAGQAAPAPVDEIDLRGILIDSVDSFRPSARAHDVSIDIRADTPLRAAVDAFRLRQVIDNVISNAIKYTPRAGGVKIVGAVLDDAVAVTVTDTGIGISQDDLPKIMTPYFRTANAKEKSGGTGLGLGISRDIVSAHGGTLTIESEAGQGTTVTVRIPQHAGADTDAAR